MVKTIYLLAISSIFLFPSMQQETIKPSESGYAPVNGLNMYYEIYGEGDMPLVLIHGGGSTIQSNFANIIPLWAENRKVIAMELQAHGRTGDRENGVSFSQDAKDVAALLKYLHVNKADILGFSNGGNTAMKTAMEYPEIINKLVVASSFYRRNGLLPGFFDGMRNATLENMPEPLKKAYLEVNPDERGLQNMHDKDKERMLRFTDWKDEDLANIKAPTLFLAADRDVVLPEHSLKMSQTVPGSRLLILPGNHGSYLGEICTEPTEQKSIRATALLVQEFLDR